MQNSTKSNDTKANKYQIDSQERLRTVKLYPLKEPEANQQTLQRILERIPLMSIHISDPARHEKIISYVQDIVVVNPQHVMEMYRLGAFDSFEVHSLII